VDAVPLPELGIEHEHPIKADRHVVSVAAASIIAKVTRDRLLTVMDTEFTGYGFAVHKGVRHARALPGHRLARPLYGPPAQLRRHLVRHAVLSRGVRSHLPPRPARRTPRATQPRGEAS
jgi:ribonuclease HII